MLEVSRKGLSVPLTSWWSRLRTTGACGVEGHERSKAVSTAWPGAEFKGQATPDALWTSLGSRPSAGGRRGFPTPPTTAQRCPFCPPEPVRPQVLALSLRYRVQSPRPLYGAPISGLQNRQGLRLSPEVAGASLRFNKPGLTPLCTGPPAQCAGTGDPHGSACSTEPSSDPTRAPR